jgi:hypothetical protein
MKCMVKGCEEDATTLVEGGFYICEKHIGPKHWVCKFCGVAIVSDKDTRAGHGNASHKPTCPRATKE